MIERLIIENVALIEKATLEFDDKLNCLSGETGSGKSIMLDALSFVFGGRAERSLIREGADFMRVKAIFVALTTRQKEYIEGELSVTIDDEVFISRELDSRGKNTCKVNGEIVPVASIKKICSLLVDVHGQSEHLAILNNDYQLQILDLYSKTAEGKLATLNALIDEVVKIDAEIKALGGSEAEKSNLIDLYSYQIKEIEDAHITENEYEELTAEKKEMSQYEKINLALQSAYGAIVKNSFGESASERVDEAIKALMPISDINSHYEELLDRLKSTLIELSDVGDTIYTDMRNNVFDEARFNEIDNRIDYIKTLFRKYGGDYSHLMEYYIDIKAKLDNLINSSERYETLSHEKEKLLSKIDAVQDELTLLRKKAGAELSKKMQDELKTLGMPNARIDIVFNKINDRYSRHGTDSVEYMFSANLGFELKPLNKVVSGGEMSRVMLAYKIVVASVDEISTIIFDEIDSGISGHIAQVVAEYMARLSLKKQIIAVSHLPQICAMADRNIKVEKYVDHGTTHTTSSVLSGDELLKEIARLMGVSVNEIGLKASSELKRNFDSYKENLRLN